MADRTVHIRNLTYAWPGGDAVLTIPEFDILAGERVFLKGPSGSGKSTLLGLIAGVLAPQAGKLEVLGHDMSALSHAQRDRLRADRLGVIFQIFNLVPYLTVSQNVTLPCRFSTARHMAVQAAGGIETEAQRLLSALGMTEPGLLKRKVTQLSVGQQQRVAAARALIGAPHLIIADEPTSALDAESRNRFIDLLNEQAQANGASLLFVSHDGALAPLFDRTVDLPRINQVHTVQETI